jgi:hypothetical protein
VEYLLKINAYRCAGPEIVVDLVRFFRSPPPLPEDLDSLDLAGLRRLHTAIWVRALFVEQSLSGTDDRGEYTMALWDVRNYLEEAPEGVDEEAYLRHTLREAVRLLAKLPLPPALRFRPGNIADGHRPE